MASTPVTGCRLCGWMDLNKILDLGDQPLSERFDLCIVYPLALLECPACGLVQLSHSVDQGEVFPRNHPYATGNSSALRQHYARLAQVIVRRFEDLEYGGLCVDIGANDGTLLREVALRSAKINCVGVEPTDQGEKIVSAGLPCFREFFGRQTASRIKARFGAARVITACNVLAHVPDPAGFADAAAELLHPDGVFITENHDLASVVRGGQWDTVYHEHRWYWTVETLSRLLGNAGLEVVSVEPVTTHGGSFRTTARRKADTSQLQKTASAASVVLHDLLRHLHEQGAMISGIGATTRAVPLVTFSGIAGYLLRVCEVSGSEKIGGTLPGTSVPVVDEGELLADTRPHQYALILSWHMAAHIMKSLRRKGYQGKFIIPLPRPEVIP